MIVLSVGMRKSGSGWYFNMTNDLLQAAGGRDARQMKNRRWLRSIVQGNNCTIGRLKLSKLVRLALPHRAGHPFAVKTHSGPAPSLRAFTATGLAKVTYLYRDPREENGMMAEFLWAWEPFDTMRRRHEALMEEYPNTPTRRGVPFEGMDVLSQND